MKCPIAWIIGAIVTRWVNVGRILSVYSNFSKSDSETDVYYYFTSITVLLLMLVLLPLAQLFILSLG